MENEYSKETEKKKADGILGAHPVGTSVGTVGGAVTGGAIGSTVGPIGTVVGAIAGGIAGGMAGRKISNAIDPKVEDEYWKSNYSRQPYVERNTDYTVYEPAYRTGYVGYTQHVGKTFEQAESDLQRDYDKARGAIPLGWDKAKHAARDAWQRVDKTFATNLNRITTPNTTNEKVIDRVNKLIGIAADGKQGYTNAAEEVKDTAMKASFLRFSQQRLQYVRTLQHQVTLHGGKAEDDGGDTRGMLHRTWMDMKAVFTSGSKDAIIKACTTGEEAAIKEYDAALAEPYITGEVQRILVEQKQGIQDALTTIKAHADSL